MSGVDVDASDKYATARRISGVRFVNPFNPDNAAILDAALPQPDQA